MNGWGIAALVVAGVAVYLAIAVLWARYLITDFYHQHRDQGMNHESALRDAKSAATFQGATWPFDMLIYQPAHSLKDKLGPWFHAPVERERVRRENEVEARKVLPRSDEAERIVRDWVPPEQRESA